MILNENGVSELFLHRIYNISSPFIQFIHYLITYPLFNSLFNEILWVSAPHTPYIDRIFGYIQARRLLVQHVGLG